MLKEYVAKRIAIMYKLNERELKEYLEKRDVKRGRPKRDKRVISQMIQGGDLIERLIAEARIIENREEESSEEIVVKNFDYKGVRYLKALDDTVYSKTTHEEIGRWNVLKGEIELN